MSLTIGTDGHWRNAKKGEKIWMYIVEKAKSGRARCRRCSDVVKKDDLRFGIPIRDPRGEHGYISAWQHVGCTRVDPLEDDVPGELKDYISGFLRLCQEDQEEVIKEITSTERPAHLQELNPDDMVKKEPCPPMEPPAIVTQGLLPFQKEGLAWMVQQELGELKGGILADEMGMGKTIQTVSLIATNKGVGPTLVVCPVSSMMQWQEEINNHILPGEMKVVVFSKTKKAKKEELELADVVITSYPVLELMWRNIVAETKVACKYCKQLFLPRKLHIHNKYFCGPNAKKTAKQSKQEKTKNKQSKTTIKKGLQALHVDVDEEDLGGGDEEMNKLAAKQSGGKKGVKGGKKNPSSDDNVAPAKKKQRLEKEEEAEEEGDAEPTEGGKKKVHPGYSMASAIDEGKIAGPMGMYRELMAEAGRNARSRWERKRAKPTSSDDESEEDDDSSDDDSDDASSDDSSDDSTSSDDEDSSDEDDSSEDDDDSEDDQPQKKKKRGSVGNAPKATTTRKEEVVIEEDDATAALKKKVICPDCNFPLRKFLFCPRTGKQHVWEKITGIDEDQGDVGGEAVDLSKSILHSIKWFRIVLDEAHRIKSRTTGTTKSAFALTAERKWCLTGTPLQNRVGDLYSLLRFLRFAPYANYYCSAPGCTCSCLSHPFSGRLELRACVHCGHGPLQHYSYFNKHIMNPINRYGYVGDGRKALMLLTGTVLNKCMLRRTKEERANDMKLPPCAVEVKFIEPSEEETDFYTSLYKKSTSNFDTFVKKGTVLHNYAHIFQLLSRLRQALDHPYLVAFSHSEDGTSLVSTSALPAVSVSSSDVCAICMEDVSRADTIELAPCKHRFHRLCLRQYFDAMPDSKKLSCPKCFNVVTLDLRKLNSGEDLEDEEGDGNDGDAKKKGGKKPGGKKSGAKKENDEEAELAALQAEEEVDDAMIAPVPEDDDEDEDDEDEGDAVPKKEEVEEKKIKVEGTDDQEDDDDDEIFNDASAAGTKKKKQLTTSSSTTNGGQSEQQTDKPKKVKKSSILNRFDTKKFVTSTKLESIVTHIQDIPAEEKVIVFSQFGMMLDLVEFRLERAGIRTVKLNGSMQLSMRQASLKAFRTEPNVRVILISLKAGGEGLNLQNANHVILIDPWWNPAVEMQAVQRAHRIGQTRPVKAVRFVTKGTIEERMLQLQDKKMLVFEGTIDGKATSLHRLSQEDLQFLFQ